MDQRLVIRCIPVVAFGVALGLGWLAFSAFGPVSSGWWDTAVWGGALSPVFTPEVQHWSSRIVRWAAAYQLDPNLAATVMQVESCGAPAAVSSAGAQGLFQVMPFHFSPLDDMQDPDINAQRGLAYLALGLMRAGGNAGLALAGYNGGHGQIGRDRSLWPAETRRYVYWGSGIYADAVAGAVVSPRLQEWLQAGGSSLCARAARELGLGD